MLLKKRDFVKLEQSLCIFRYIIIFTMVFNLETEMYFNESLFEGISILSVLASLWSALIYTIGKRYGTSRQNQYCIGLIEWMVDLVILDLFAHTIGSYGSGFIYLFIILLGIIACIRYGNSITTYILLIGLLGNTFFIHEIIYRHFYLLKTQRFAMSIASLSLVSYWFYYISKKQKKCEETINRLQTETKELEMFNESIKKLYMMNTSIYQAMTLEEVTSQLLENIYKLVGEEGIGVILYDENGIESNSKMYTYEDLILYRSTETEHIPFKIVYAQKEIENIRECKAYKNCILNYEPIVLTDRLDGLDYTYTILPGKNEKYMYMFNLMKDNKECGLILLHVEKRIEHIKCVYINEIVHHAGIALYKMQQLEKEYTRAAYDQVTGAKTRHYMEEVLPRYEKKIKHMNSSLGVLFIDIDHFKRFNDQYGHALGDLVLKTVSKIIQETFSKDSLVIRYGGEEFVVIIPGVSSKLLEEKAYNLCNYIEQYNLEELINQECRITVSIGGALYPDDGKRVDEVIKKADEAMYKVKQTTRNSVCLYNKIDCGGIKDENKNIRVIGAK